MKIHPVNHAKGDKNRYCGPAAISIVTGMNTGQAARLIRHVSGVTSVKGTSLGQMLDAFGKCGVTFRRVIVKPARAKDTRPTLTQWYRDSKALRSAGRVFLISAGHHWQIVSGRRFCCGRTGEIVSITAKGTNRRARVADVIELFSLRITIPAICEKPKSKVDPFRKALTGIERKLGVRGKLEWNSGVRDYVLPTCAAFPRSFSTMHHNWMETLERVETCLEPGKYEECADRYGHVSF